MDHIRHTEDWSGDRLICLGEYSSDWPESIHNEELELLMESYTYHFSREPDNIDQLLCAFSHSLRKIHWPYEYHFTRRCRLTKRHRPSRDFKAWFGLSDALENLEPQSKSENDGTHVLRNLSKKVYVCQDALALKSDDGCAPLYYISFGSLVLARIAWSSDDSGMGIADDADLHRGVWAGDRFDIVNLATVEHDDGWTDVSAEARMRLDEMLEDLYGSDWECYVRNNAL